MQNAVRKIYQTLLYTPLKKPIEKLASARYVLKCKSSIYREYGDSTDEEITEVIDYLRKHKNIPWFPYDYTEKYWSMDVEIHRDEDGYPYTYVDGKKLFGRKSQSDERFIRECRGRMSEQDSMSPHCYCPSKNHEPKDGCIIAELGAAEAMFSLSYIERARKVYLFECLEEWIIPLQKTFEPWKDKVEIVRKYVDEKSRGDYIAIDDFFEGKYVTVIKADIEGFEVPMMRGGRRTFRDKIDQTYLCAYHRWDDEDNITRMLNEYRFNIWPNRRYMINIGSDFANKMLRRGVIYGEKE